MKKRVSKKLVSILACVGLIAGFASVSNAATKNFTLNPGVTGQVDYISKSAGTYSYSYAITYVHFDGLPVGAFMPGLDFEVSGSNPSTICSVNSTTKSGSYYLSSGGYHYYRVCNNSSKKVIVNGTYSY